VSEPAERGGDHAELADGLVDDLGDGTDIGDAAGDLFGLDIGF